MKIEFTSISGTSATLVAQTNEGIGVWFGPFGCASGAAAVVDRKQPIDADRAVIRSMKNATGSLRFSAHYIAESAEDASTMALTHPLTVMGLEGKMTFSDGADGTYEKCVIASCDVAELTGCYLRADYVIEF